MSNDVTYPASSYMYTARCGACRFRSPPLPPAMVTVAHWLCLSPRAHAGRWTKELEQPTALPSVATATAAEAAHAAE